MLTATYFHVLNGNSCNESEIRFVQINNTPQFTHHLLLLTIVWQVVFGIHSRDRYNPNVLVKTKIDFFYCSNVRGLQIISLCEYMQLNLMCSI